MSELQDWKLKAQAVVKLCSKKCDKSVSLSVYRRLATGNVQRVCSATYQILFKYFFFRLSILKPNPNPNLKL